MQWITCKEAPVIDTRYTRQIDEGCDRDLLNPPEPVPSICIDSPFAIHF